MPQSPTGEQVELRHGNQVLVVVSGGAGIRTYSVDGQAMLDGYAEDEICAGGRGQMLIPWPNRIRDGVYTFAGARQRLAITEPEQNTAIHGFSRWHTWTVGERSEQRVVFAYSLLPQMGYPHTLDLRVEYELGDAGVVVRPSATNVGGAPAPYACGAHPYLRPGPGMVDEWTLTLPAATHLLTDAQQVPVGSAPVEGTPFDYRAPRLIGEMKLDTAYADLQRDPDGLARIVVANRAAGTSLTLWMDAGYPYVMAFTGDTLADRARHGLGIEPMTGAPNAFASGEGLVTLEPGQTHTAAWGITPG